MPRWRATRLLRHEPVLAFVLPVRDIRVLFALTHKNYDGFMKHQLPHAHEYYAPMETLMAFGSDKNPQLGRCWHAPLRRPISSRWRRARSGPIPTFTTGAGRIGPQINR